jgi:hypothetical protein
MKFVCYVVLGEHVARSVQTPIGLHFAIDLDEGVEDGASRDMLEGDALGGGAGGRDPYAQLAIAVARLRAKIVHHRGSRA